MTLVAAAPPMTVTAQRPRTVTSTVPILMRTVALPTRGRRMPRTLPGRPRGSLHMDQLRLTVAPGTTPWPLRHAHGGTDTVPCPAGAHTLRCFRPCFAFSAVSHGYTSAFLSVFSAVSAVSADQLQQQIATTHRPLPTPCRNVAPLAQLQDAVASAQAPLLKAAWPPANVFHVDMVRPLTLLEHSRWESPVDPLKVAAAIVTVLVDHFSPAEPMSPLGTCPSTS